MSKYLSEKLEVYDLNEDLIEIKQRKHFYEEIKEEFEKTGKITKKLKTVRLLLLNSKGRIYLQKRSKIKNENAGLYDKTIGGHVAAGDTSDMSLIRECAEELGFPAAVVPEENFEKAVRVTDLKVIGVFRRLDYVPTFVSIRISKDKKAFHQPLMNQFYYGYYDGPIRFVDGESSGVEVFSLDELKEELHDFPEKFTEDIKWMIKKYGKYMKPIKK